MRKRLATAICALAVMAIGAPSASAATEFGDSCAGNNSTGGGPPATLFELSAAGNTLPSAAPSAGVLTRWHVNLIPTPISLPQTLKVLRLNPAAKTAAVVGEASGNVTGGVNNFEARIPIQVGDRLGLFGSPPLGVLICKSPGESVLGAYEGPGGSATPYVEIPTAETRVPVTATIEPDADNDGYGDETQDKCPQSAAIQTECPLAILDAVPVAGKGVITVYLSTSAAATISVTGTAPLPKAPEGKAGSSAKVTLKAATQSVTPGKLARFKLKLPGSLKSAVAALPPGKSISVKITAAATNVAGAVSKAGAKVKLR